MERGGLWCDPLVSGEALDLDARDAERGIDTRVTEAPHPIRVCKPRPKMTWHERAERTRLADEQTAAIEAESLTRPAYQAPHLECWPTSLTRRQCGLPPLDERMIHEDDLAVYARASMRARAR